MGKRVKGIPYRLSPHKGYRHSVRWFLRSFRARVGMSLRGRLESEIEEALTGDSLVHKWKKNLTRAVARNRHNATYRW